MKLTYRSKFNLKTYEFKELIDYFVNLKKRKKLYIIPIFLIPRYYKLVIVILSLITLSFLIK